MKSKYLITALVAGIIGSQALANQVTLKNASPNHQPLNIVYKIAHKNPGEDTVYSAPMQTTVTDQSVISFGLDGYALAGIVPVSINGHRLPPFHFDEPEQCAVATNKKHTSAWLTFAVDQHKATCATEGGNIIGG